MHGLLTQCKKSRFISHTSKEEFSVAFLNKLVDSNNMFRACPSLVGGAGTVFDPTFIDGTAARIDGGTESHGYFTHIVDKQNTATYSIEQTLDKDYQDDFEVEDEMSIPISDEELLLD